MSTSFDQARQNPAVLFSGTCACHRIGYTCTAVPASTTNCFCVTCRKLSGAAHQTFTHVNPSSVTFYDSTENTQHGPGLPGKATAGIALLTFAKVSERGFCATCYTPVAFRYHVEPENLGIPVGTVDEESVREDRVREGLKAERDIFVSHKPSWVERGDLPGEERFTKGFEEQLKW